METLSVIEVWPRRHRQRGAVLGAYALPRHRHGALLRARLEQDHRHWQDGQDGRVLAGEEGSLNWGTKKLMHSLYRVTHPNGKNLMLT